MYPCAMPCASLINIQASSLVLHSRFSSLPVLPLPVALRVPSRYYSSLEVARHAMRCREYVRSSYVVKKQLGSSIGHV